eukprot:ANDGO_07169.mRNA.1 putative glutamine--fructose-6-phosphate aminotransferase
MCGIFGLLNCESELSRTAILRLLLKGLSRLEYRGYDSAGVAFDRQSGSTDVQIVKSNGNVSKLVNLLKDQGYLPDTNLDSEHYDEDDFSPELMLSNHVGIAHTRWATHGEPSPANSHPHRSDKDSTFIVVHNGMITNFSELKNMLKAKGHVFESETDTEVFAKLLGHVYNQYKSETDVGKKPKVSFVEIVRAAVSQLEGTYAFLVKSRLFPGELIAARFGSPLIIGVCSSGEEATDPDAEFTVPLSARLVNRKSTAYLSADGRRESQNFVSGKSNTDSRDFIAEGAADLTKRAKAFFLSSDASAIIEHTRTVLYLEDKDIVHLANGRMRIYNQDVVTSSDAGKEHRVIKILQGQMDAVRKGNFDHYMQKEIFEQKESLTNTMRGRVLFDKCDVRLGGVLHNARDILTCRRVHFLACGSSYHSSLAGRQLFEQLTSLPAAVELASEFVDRSPNVFRDETYIFISQSGETADSLRALRYVKAQGALTCGITNTVGSAIARETDFGIHVNAGLEIGVASTKAYTSQVLSVVLLSLFLSKNARDKEEVRQQIIEDLHRLPELVDKTLHTVEPVIKELIPVFQGAKSILVVGRGYNYATALEGALKIKEISYIHSEGISAAELKHGTIALVDENMPCILIITKDTQYPNVVSALEQLTARHGKVVAICNTGDTQVISKAYKSIQVPEICASLAPIINVIPFQLLSYHLAVSMGHNVDQPRNLAKSVVV